MAALLISHGESGRTLLEGQLDYGFPLSTIDIMIFKGHPNEIEDQLKEYGINIKRKIDTR